MMQSKLRREGFELADDSKEPYIMQVDDLIFRSCAALITHCGSEVIPPTERPSINAVPNAAPLNNLEQTVFNNEIVAKFGETAAEPTVTVNTTEAAFNNMVANYDQVAPEVSYPTMPTFATIEDPVPAEINPNFDLTDQSQHDYAEFLGAK